MTTELKAVSLREIMALHVKGEVDFDALVKAHLALEERTNQRDTALAENLSLLAENDRLNIDLSDAQESSKSLQRENEALRKTVAQREEHLRDIATISARYKS